jgi:hypothetical protein
MTIGEKVRKTLAELGVIDAVLVLRREAWSCVPTIQKGFL